MLWWHGHPAHEGPRARRPCYSLVLPGGFDHVMEESAGVWLRFRGGAWMNPLFEKPG